MGRLSKAMTKDRVIPYYEETAVAPKGFKKFNYYVTNSRPELNKYSEQGYVFAKSKKAVINKFRKHWKYVIVEKE